MTLVLSKEAASLLGVKPQTLRRWRYAGRGPRYVRLGDNMNCPVAYRLADIDEWLEHRSFSTTAEETVAHSK